MALSASLAPAAAPVPRPGILDISPYVGGESKAEASRLIRLASNESALGVSPTVVEAIRAAAPDSHRYPDGNCTALREALARTWGLEAGRIVCGAGSDELIALLTRAYAGPGDEVLYSAHGFLMYPLSAKGAGATPVSAPERGLRTDVDALLAAVTDRTRIVYLANPNNPTGSFLEPAEVERLHAGLPPHVVLALDAAYAEYMTGRNDYSAGADLVDRARNVVMLRTFSKIYGLGGLRLGWAYGSAEIVDVLNRVRGPFNVGALAQVAGLAALADTGFVEASRALNDRVRPWTADRLTELGLIVHPSVANFLLVEFSEGAAAEAARLFLKARGILVRQMGGYGLPATLRFSIGTEEEMRLVVDAVAAFLAETPAAKPNGTGT